MVYQLKELSNKDIMEKLELIINNKVEYIEGMNAVYQYEIKDDNTTFQLSIDKNKAKIANYEESTADCVLFLTRANFESFIKGDISGIAAIITRKLKVKGDLGKAIRMEEMFKKYNLKNFFE